MKSLIFFTLTLIMSSCNKSVQETVVSNEKTVSVPPYDTIAKDSFSVGAVSVDVARKIRMSSQKYQDSLREVQKKEKEEKILKEEKEKAVDVAPVEKVQNP